MEKIKLAVCIPTYNRPEVINEFFETVAFQYIEHGYDIFVYDSSEGIQTEDVVKKWKCQYSGLFYVRVDSKVHSNMKVYNIFREFGNSLEYDYIWVCSDSIRWDQCVLDSVNHYASQGYDMIVPNYRDVENIGDKEYSDRNSFFEDCAWHVTLYGAAILKASTMLTNVDWNFLIEKYGVPDCINFSHVAFYFEKICTMNKWKAIHLSFSEKVLTPSVLKKCSGWRDAAFYVCCCCWPTVINKLPDCYENKEKVIMQNGVNSETLLYPNLRKLRIDNILDLKICHLYRDKWHCVTTVPLFVIWILAILPPQIVVYLDKSYIKEIFLKKKIRRFCRKFDKIYIFGAGLKAKRYTKYLDAMRISFEAYLVSNPLDNVETLNDHKVMPFNEELLDSNGTGILLALNKENTIEVYNSILNIADKKKIFSDFKSKALTDNRRSIQ